MNQAHPVAEFVNESVSTTSGITVGDFVVFGAEGIPVQNNAIGVELSIFGKLSVLLERLAHILRLL